MFSINGKEIEMAEKELEKLIEKVLQMQLYIQLDPVRIQLDPLIHNSKVNLENHMVARKMMIEER